MNIKYIKINNILSIADVELEFSDSGLILLDGWNYDTGSANAAGKTAIFNALSFALYGKLPRKITMSELLRRGTKSGYVKVGVETKAGFLEVKRCRPNSVEFYINGEQVDMVQEEFESHLGLTYAQYLICMYTPQVNSNKFLSLNDSSKKDFILELMDLNRFAEYKKLVDANIGTFSQQKIDLEKKIVADTSAIEVYKEQLVNTSEIRDQIAKLDPKPLQEKIDAISVDSSRLDQLYALRDKVVSIMKTASETDALRRAKQLEIDQAQTYLQSLENSKILQNELECPYCNKAFDSSNMHTIEQAKERKTQQIEQYRQLCDRLNSELANFPKGENLNELQSMYDKTNQKIAHMEQDNQHKNAERIRLTNQMDINRGKIATLLEQAKSNDVIVGKIDALKQRIVECNSSVVLLDDKVNYLSAISSALAPTGAPAYIMESVVNVFNDYMSGYVAMIWPVATYTLQSFKENKSKNVRAKFSEKLIINGRECSLGSLSGGELKCLSMAADLAVVDVVEKMFGLSINPVVFDEPFEGLDAVNRGRVIDLLAQAASSRQIWIIDHASEAKAMFSDIIRIEKRSGISALVV